MTWAFVAFAIALMVYALAERRLQGSIVTAPMVFTGFGILAGVVAADVQLQPRGPGLAILAEATLTVVLFADASRIDLANLRSGIGLPARLLGIGLPLTIVLGTAVAIVGMPSLLLLEAAILAVCLAPTDAALGQAVASDRRIPTVVRQGLNVESGLNDGICVPVLLVALEAARAEAGEATLDGAFAVLAAELGWGVVAGVVAGVAGAAIIATAVRGVGMSAGWRRVTGLAAAGLAYGLAVALGGSAFIGAFVAGLVFGAVMRRTGLDPDPATALTEDLGAILGAGTFVIFGAGVVVPLAQRVAIGHIGLAILFLTVVRMVPVAIALIGSRASPRTVLFAGWFGPRGLASIVFGILVLEEGAGLGGLDEITIVIATTVLLSVVAHGLTAAPAARRYGAWFEEAVRADPTIIEARSVAEQRPRSLSPADADRSGLR